MIFLFSNSKDTVICGVGKFIFPESRNICISRMFVSTSLKLSPCSPDTRAPRVHMARMVVHGSTGVPWQLHSPLRVLNPCFPRRDPSSRCPRAGGAAGGRWLAGEGDGSPGIPGGSAASSPGLGCPALQFPAQLPCATRSPHSHAPVLLQKQQPSITEYLQ